MAQRIYPLEQVLDVKKKRVEDAEKEVRAKEVALEKEKEILAQKEAERDKVLHHRNEKLEQLRQTLDHETTSPKIQQMKAYLKIVKEKLVIEEKKVQQQKEQVEIAKTNLEVAKDVLRERRKEVDKLELHKKEWLKEALKEATVEEVREQDDMGTVTFLSQLRKKE